MAPIFMVVGGSHNGVIAIQKAKELGMKVLVADAYRNAEGAKLGDYFEKLDTTDFTLVERVARKYGIVGCLTRSEALVPTVCHVNEALNLPKQGSGIGKMVTDKYIMRERFYQSGVRCPYPFYKIENETEFETVRKVIEEQFREHSFIVKPSDRGGSIGIQKMNRFDEFKRSVQAAIKQARNKKVVIEKFIEGIEYGAQGFSVDGEMVLCFISKKVTAGDMATIGHAYPVSLLESEIQTIKNECTKALKSLGVENGPSTIDLIMDRDGCPHILEIGARAGGTRLPEVIWAHSGFDIVKASISLACGHKIIIPPLKNTPVAGLLLYFEKSGEVERVHPYESLLERYRPVDYEISVGENTRVWPHESIYGYVICKGTNAESAINSSSAFMKEMRQLIVFKGVSP